jgi:hypothetical protein
MGLVSGYEVLKRARKKESDATRAALGRAV